LWKEEPIGQGNKPEGGAYLLQPACVQLATWSLQPSNLQADVRLYVLYNDNKYMYASSICGCLFKHGQFHTGFRKIREKKVQRFNEYLEQWFYFTLNGHYENTLFNLLYGLLYVIMIDLFLFCGFM
jgi:hypothetical protein